ncbi:hypothetical protein WKW50_14240 [Ochrobactrum sp. GPK 3]|uniref:hypothetical protein n=1 Tax=Brucella sp. 22210 TaxID=3453892 RepID=UPI003138519A
MPKITIQSILTGEYLKLGSKIGPDLWVVNMMPKIDPIRSYWELTSDLNEFPQPISISTNPGINDEYATLGILNGQISFDGILVNQCIAHGENFGDNMVFNFVKFDPNKQFYFIEYTEGRKLIVFDPREGDDAYHQIYLENTEIGNDLEIKGEKFFITEHF